MEGSKKVSKTSRSDDGQTTMTKIQMTDDRTTTRAEGDELHKINHNLANIPFDNTSFLALARTVGRAKVPAHGTESVLVISTAVEARWYLRGYSELTQRRDSPGPSPKFETTEQVPILPILENLLD